MGEEKKYFSKNNGKNAIFRRPPWASTIPPKILKPFFHFFVCFPFGILFLYWCLLSVYVYKWLSYKKFGIWATYSKSSISEQILHGRPTQLSLDSSLIFEIAASGII